MPKKESIAEYNFKSGSTDRTYTVKRYEDGSLSCDCPGWRFSPKRTSDGHRECRHTRIAESTPIENLTPAVSQHLPKINYKPRQINQSTIQPTKRMFYFEED